MGDLETRGYRALGSVCRFVYLAGALGTLPGDDTAQSFAGTCELPDQRA